MQLTLKQLFVHTNVFLSPPHLKRILLTWSFPGQTEGIEEIERYERWTTSMLSKGRVDTVTHQGRGRVTHTHTSALGTTDKVKGHLHSPTLMKLSLARAMQMQTSAFMVDGS